MASNVLAEILKWSKTRPDWQRDALRRLFVAGKVEASDIHELTEICKAGHGLVEHKAPTVLSENDLAIAPSSVGAVSLAKLTHHFGVNALAAEQTVTFGPNLTVIFGETAAGKSGYTRIMKSACRSRFVETILGDVLSGSTPLTAAATLTLIEAGTEKSVSWTAGNSTSELAAVSVFDAHCVPIYLRDKTDVAFRPFSLDVFDGLSEVSSEVRKRLESEIALLKTPVTGLPTGLPDGTAARKLVDGLSALTKETELNALATLSSAEQSRLSQLQQKVQNASAADPKEKAKQLKLKASRFEVLADHLKQVAETLGTTHLEAIQMSATQVSDARETLNLLRTTALTPDLLEGTGGSTWRLMWNAVRTFSGEAYPGAPFPNTEAGARCPFCQQEVQADAASRLKHLAEYVASQAQQELDHAESTLQATLSLVKQTTVIRTDLSATIEELRTDEAAGVAEIESLLKDAESIQSAVIGASATGGALPAKGVEQKVAQAVFEIVKQLRERAAQLQTDTLALTASETKELNDLDSRKKLGEALDAVLAEIERKKKIGAYTLCIDETSTTPITKKSSELSKRLITDHLSATFSEEIKKLEFTHLSVEMRDAGGSKGKNFHKLVFKNAPGVTMTSVLSEGEARTLALASFLAELSTAAARSAIVFDDPVSSLDHIWRARIARRLAAEAKVRQVIVFTHDLLFLRALMDEAEKQDVPLTHQYVRREGQSGICSPDLPWVAMKVSARQGVLRKRWQDADATLRKQGQAAYEPQAREIFGMLRETWERGVGEILMNDAVERYRPSIETKRIAVLHDITTKDCEIVENEMTTCSKWIRGHDAAMADGTPLPTPAEVKARIDELDGWVKTITDRRKKKK